MSSFPPRSQAIHSQNPPARRDRSSGITMSLVSVAVPWAVSAPTTPHTGPRAIANSVLLMSMIFISFSKSGLMLKSIIGCSYNIKVLKQHHMRQLEARLQAGPKWQENDLVFCNIYGNFLHPYRLYLMFNKVLDKAGIPRLRFH